MLEAEVKGSQGELPSSCLVPDSLVRRERGSPHLHGGEVVQPHDPHGLSPGYVLVQGVAQRVRRVCADDERPVRALRSKSTKSMRVIRKFTAMKTRVQRRLQTEVGCCIALPPMSRCMTQTFYGFEKVLSTTSTTTLHEHQHLFTTPRAEPASTTAKPSHIRLIQKAAFLT